MTLSNTNRGTKANTVNDAVCFNTFIFKVSKNSILADQIQIPALAFVAIVKNINNSMY